MKARLLPRVAMYRAFPELDRFGDEQCVGLVAQARARHGPPHLIVPPLAWLGLSAVWIGLAMPVALSVPSESWAAGLGVLSFILCVFVFPVAAFWVRDAWVRRSLRRVIVDARCPRCNYSMLGLPEHEGVVRCPECGFARPASEMREVLALQENSAPRGEVAAEGGGR